MAVSRLRHGLRGTTLGFAAAFGVISDEGMPSPDEEREEMGSEGLGDGKHDCLQTTWGE